MTKFIELFIFGGHLVLLFASDKKNAVAGTKCVSFLVGWVFWYRLISSATWHLLSKAVWIMHDSMAINRLRPGQNGRHFADDIFKCMYLNENVWTLIKISLKFVPKGPINNIPALVQIMAWSRPGDKPLSEPMTVKLPTHMCVTRPQWVKAWGFYLYRDCSWKIFGWKMIWV